jgi:large subunit ribosomal protein L15
VKLHDLKPAPGSRKARTRVGRGIAAGKGKTAGRGTKGQKSRAGSGIPAWFEGGQTPIHVRVPKLRGFKRRGRIEYQVVNVGRIAEYAAAGRFGVEPEATSGKRGAKDAPTTVNAVLLASAGLIGSDRRPVKVLGNGEVEIKLFVTADAFTASARRKIEAAGGHVQPLVEPAEADAEAKAGSAAEAGQPAEAVAEAGTVEADAAEADDKPAPKRTRRTQAAATAAESQPAAEDAAPAAPDDGAESATPRKRTRKASQD